MTAPERRVRLLIVERHKLFANALAELLSSNGVHVSGIVTPADEKPGENQPVDVILIDIDNGIELIETFVPVLRDWYPSAAICAMSTEADPDVMRGCLSRGVVGYVVKDISIEGLTDALRSLATAGSYVDPRAAGELLRRRAIRHARENTKLSDRETEILRLIAEGLTNRSIGEHLLLSEKTVKNHVSRIFSKLHLSKRSQAAIHATRNGLT